MGELCRPGTLGTGDEKVIHLGNMMAAIVIATARGC